MTQINKENKGRRVRLIETHDKFTKLRPGDEGTYEYAIINGEPPHVSIQHSIKWDSGSRLMLWGRSDKFEFIQ